MPVYKDRQRNTWYVSFSYKDAFGIHKKILKRGFTTKHEAQAWEVKQKAESIPTTQATFREMLNMYLLDSNAKEYLTLRKTHWLEKYFSEYIDKQISKIKKSDLVLWRNSLLTYDEISVFNRNTGIEYVKSVFNFANNIYDFPNPSASIKRFKVNYSDKKEMEVWTIDEFNSFIECVYLPYYKAFFSFLYWTGCRRGEALALTKDDIQDDKVSINKSIRNNKKGFTDLKTNSSKRIITIDEDLLDELQPLIERANPFIFGGERALSVTTIQRVFDKAIKDSGVKKIRIHDLRHSHATFLINNGVNIVAVSKRLGHATINQTLETYTHLLEKTNDELMNVIRGTKMARKN